MITASPQVASQNSDQDPGDPGSVQPIVYLRGAIILVTVTIAYVFVALVWSAAGRRDIDFAIAAACAAAAGAGIGLLFAILASHVERDISSARWGWTAIALATGVATATAVANLYAVWADGAVLWRPRSVQWIESAGAVALFVGVFLLVKRAKEPERDLSAVLNLLVVALAGTSVLVVAVRLAIDGWPPEWSTLPAVIGIAVSASAMLLAGSTVVRRSWPFGTGTLGLSIAAGIWAIATLFQDIGAWSGTPGLVALGRWVFPLFAIGLIAAILYPVGPIDEDEESAGQVLYSPTLNGFLPLVSGLVLAIATIAALLSGHGIAADLAEITALIVLLQFGRIACNLRIERRRVRTLIDSTERLERLANVDMLTGLPNRAALEIRLDEEMERAARYEQPMSVCFVDIDHFKRVNDLYGHAAGDSVLRQIAGCLQLTARSIDFVGRYGGEEFVIIAPGTWSADALVLAERIRGQVGKLAVDAVSGEPIDLSVSIGIAGFPEHADSLALLMERADAALYQSKANGRNRVTLWSIDPAR